MVNPYREAPEVTQEIKPIPFLCKLGLHKYRLCFHGLHHWLNTPFGAYKYLVCVREGCPKRPNKFPYNFIWVEMGAEPRPENYPSPPRPSKARSGGDK